MSLDTGPEPDALPGFTHPRATAALVGHEAAQATFLAGVRSGRLHHAWLIGGPEGIGKATFAYLTAKMLLGLPPGGQPAMGDLYRIDPGAKASRIVATLAHPDFVVLRRQPATDKKAVSGNIPVGTVRKALELFGSTAGGGGWRVCIVDSAEDLDGPSANALLKVIEEPPPRSIFLIVAHQPRRVLATIRSRCRKIGLSALSRHEVEQALQLQRLPNPPHEIARAAALADGSVRRALTRLDPETVSLIEGTRGLLDALPSLDLAAVLAMGDTLAPKAASDEFEVFLETVDGWMTDMVRQEAGLGAARLAPLVQVWEKTARAARETDVLNLDRRPLVLSIFTDLADAVSRMRMS